MYRLAHREIRVSEKKRFSVRLMRWSDSSTSGRTVTLKLPDDDNDHPFKGLPVGSKNGQEMEMEIWVPENLPVASKTRPTSATPSKQNPRGTVVVGPLTRRVIQNSEPVASEPRPVSSAQGSLPKADEPKGEPTASTPAIQNDAQPPHTHKDPIEPDTSAEGLAQHAESRHVEEEIASYAERMGHAAEALAAVADRIGPDDEGEVEENEELEAELDDDPSQVGARTVRRAIDLCRAVDNQRAGFFYFMRTMYPNVPKLPADGDDWSRDSKATRDRVCFHCEMNALDSLADDNEARKRFEELEHDFERTERFR